MYSLHTGPAVRDIPRPEKSRLNLSDSLAAPITHRRRPTVHRESHVLYKVLQWGIQLFKDHKENPCQGEHVTRNLRLGHDGSILPGSLPASSGSQRSRTGRMMNASQRAAFCERSSLCKLQLEARLSERWVEA